MKKRNEIFRKFKYTHLLYRAARLGLGSAHFGFFPRLIYSLIYWVRDCAGSVRLVEMGANNDGRHNSKLYELLLKHRGPQQISCCAENFDSGNSQ